MEIIANGYVYVQRDNIYVCFKSTKYHIIGIVGT